MGGAGKDREFAMHLELDEAIVRRAIQLGGHSSATEAVTAALRLYIEKLEQHKVLELFGSIEYDDTYDYKEQRSRD
jgi:hypothetical protein